MFAFIALALLVVAPAAVFVKAFWQHNFKVMFYSLSVAMLFGGILLQMYFWRQRADYLLGGYAPFGTTESDGLMTEFGQVLYQAPFALFVVFVLAGFIAHKASVRKEKKPKRIKHEEIPGYEESGQKERDGLAIFNQDPERAR